MNLIISLGNLFVKHGLRWYDSACVSWILLLWLSLAWRKYEKQKSLCSEVVTGTAVLWIEDNKGRYDFVDKAGGNSLNGGMFGSFVLNRNRQQPDNINITQKSEEFRSYTGVSKHNNMELQVKSHECVKTMS